MEQEKFLSVKIEKKNKKFFGAVRSQNKDFFNVSRSARAGDKGDHAWPCPVIPVVEHPISISQIGDQLGGSGDHEMRGRKNREASSKTGLGRQRHGSGSCDQKITSSNSQVGFRKSPSTIPVSCESFDGKKAGGLKGIGVGSGDDFPHFMVIGDLFDPIPGFIPIFRAKKFTFKSQQFLFKTMGQRGVGNGCEGRAAGRGGGTNGWRSESGLDARENARTRVHESGF